MLMFSWLPKNVSTFGGDVDSILYLIYYIVLMWFLLTYGTIGYLLVRYRRRPGTRAQYVTGNSPRQYGWILALGVIVLLLDVGIDIRGEQVWDKIKRHVPPPDLQLRVIAKQFNWEVHYPGPDGKFDTADDLQLEGQIHVPVNKVVHITLQSKDVIHSFFLPNLRLKQDAMPGRSIPVWFEATEAGVYPIPCAELCGTGHTGMQGHLTVHTPDAYKTWQKERWPTS
jgi:cytochrome c oxidase subunit 2